MQCPQGQPFVGVRRGEERVVPYGERENSPHRRKEGLSVLQNGWKSFNE